MDVLGNYLTISKYKNGFEERLFISETVLPRLLPGNY
jgi:hypothetical protein